MLGSVIQGSVIQFVQADAVPAPLNSSVRFCPRSHRSGWNESSISLTYQYMHQEEKVSSFAGSSPAVREAINTEPTQSETKEVVMKKTSFKLNLQSKWVVGLVVSLSLGLGVVPTRSYVTSI